MNQQTLAGFHLSPQQTRLWHLLADAAPGAFRTRTAVAIQGPLDSARLREALEEVATVFEILHTRFRRLPGMALPLQVLPEEVGDVVLWRESSEPVNSAHEFTTTAARSFDLESGPLLEASLSGTGEEHLLLLELPTLCCDGAGLDNLLVALTEAYGATAQGTEGQDAEDDDGPVQYVDVAEALLELLEDEEAEEGRAFWKPRPRAPLNLPWNPLNATTEFSPHLLTRPLSADLANAVSRLAEAQNASELTVIAAAWATTLWRLTDAEELPFGVTLDGRDFEGLDTVVGLLERTVPVPLELTARQGFSDLLGNLERRLTAAREYQDFFTWEVEERGDEGGSEDERGPEFLPLAVAWETRPVHELSPGTTLRTAHRLSFTDRFTLRLSAVREGEGLTLALAWDAAQMPAAEAERTLDHVVTLLAAACAQPTAAVSELEILSPTWRRRILVEMNPADQHLGTDTCLHRRVAEQAARTPQATAVEFRGESLTYEELLERSGRLARHVRTLGAAPETRIGLCVERSPDLLVALLAILRTGAAYVPLDPDYPAERLRLMLEDAGTDLVVTQEALRETLPAGHRIVSLEAAEEDPSARSSDSADDPTVGPDHLAYVLYTSGTTGRPKGVAMSHRAILNRLLWMEAEYPLEASDRVLQKTPVSFDASIWELFCPLFAGATVVLAEPGAHRDPAGMAGAVAEASITVLQLVPSLVHPFLQSPGVDRCTSLKRLFCGGEPLPSDTLESLRRVLPNTRLINLYGPTETAIDASSWAVDEHPGTAVVPIGRPLTNARIYLLDPRGEPVARGVAGTLFIGGAGLARGYHQRPRITAECFVPDPFRGEAGARLYDSGDLARHRADGALEFLGRRDHQVKLRGLRIELGEIEEVMRRLDSVADAVVVLSDDAPGFEQLVAYVVPSGEADDLPQDWRGLLTRTLFDAMVPSQFVVLDTLPRTPNGKLDRKALPAPSRQQEAAGGELQGTFQGILASIWEDLLGVERVDAHDDFFLLGGHSLMATQLVARIRDALSIELSMRELFDAPRLAELARIVETAVKASHGVRETAIVRSDELGPAPLSFAQERLLFLDRLRPGNHAYNLPSAIRLRGTLRRRALAEALAALVARHDSLRTSFDLVDERPVQRVAEQVTFTLPRVDLTHLDETRQESAARRAVHWEARRPFDLQRGPLFRSLLIVEGPQVHTLVVTVHHIVSDAWSTGIMVREFATFYRAFATGIEPRLESLPLRYTDFTRWQRRWLQGEVLDGLVAWWRKTLEGAPELLPLPLDRPRPPVPTFRGGNEVRMLDLDLASELRSLARRQGVTLYMVLLAAYQVLLRHATGTEDVVLGTSAANRNRLSIEGILGFFINMLVMRTNLGGNPTFEDLLTRVRETALGADAHQDLPFGTLVEALRIERDASYNPVFQAVFTFEGEPAPDLALPALEVSPVPIGVDSTVFDIALVMWEMKDGLRAAFRYSSDLFRRTTIEALLEQFETILRAVVADPTVSLETLDHSLAAIAQEKRQAEHTAASAAGIRKLRKLKRKSST